MERFRAAGEQHVGAFSGTEMHCCAVWPCARLSRFLHADRDVHWAVDRYRAIATEVLLMDHPRR
jgi:hypothetical protein